MVLVVTPYQVKLNGSVTGMTEALGRLVKVGTAIAGTLRSVCPESESTQV